MSSFERAMPTIQLHEAGLANDPDDPGGITNFGISIRWLLTTGDLDHDGLPDGDIDGDGDIDADDIKKLTQPLADKLFLLYWWNKFKYGQINNQVIATKVFDFSINMGSLPAHKCLQRALRASNGIQLEIDGILGPKTLEAVNKTSPDRLLPALKQAAASYYEAIIMKNPKMSKYRNTWLRRAYANVV